MRAARLFGAAEVLREAMGERIGPANQGPYERALASIQARLDDAALASAWGEGRAMTLEQAIAYALAEDQLSP